MGRFIDLIGQKFGRLIVTGKHNVSNNGSINWRCRCNCGNEKIVRGDSLKSGLIKSCGCLRKEKATTHGFAYSLIYSIYHGMIQRCTNTNEKYYKHYGGRGIKICNRWLPENNGFINFLNDMGEPPTPKHSIDRIDNNGDYYKENCRWATNYQQHRNTRSNKSYTFNRKTQCLKDWAIEYKIKYSTLQYRVRCGWSIKRALLTPIRRKRINETN